MALVEEKLRKKLKEIAKEQGYLYFNLHIEPISSGGANYSSTLYKGKIQEPNKNDVNMFIKVAAFGEDTRRAHDVKTYEAERYIYTTIKKLITDLEDKYKVPEEDRLVMAKYYGASSTPREEMLIIEDLSARGFTTYDRLKSVDWPYASAAIRELAKFHALTMALEKEHPEVVEEFVNNYTTDWTSQEMFDIFVRTGIDRAIKLIKEENTEKFRRFWEGANVETLHEFKRPLRKRVLTHYDFRPSNLMHKYKQDGTAEVIPVDYQTVQPGSVIGDLMYFVFTGTDEEFRRLHYKQLMEYYYSELSAAMIRLGLPETEYSKEDFEYELKEKLPFGLLVAACTLPIVLVQTDDAPELEKGLDLTSFADVKTNDLFKDRLNGVVNDFVKWKVLV